jgi:phosphoglycerol transferase MdoB-like AlkP superfamily enzyme
LLLESFRAAEIGVYGSTLGLTPEFDRWSKQGIIFKNFYANGFQTRHGLVATYCSLFPNYGAAVMKRYSKNNFMCLPEILKNIGYATSWVYGSDANFDGQSTFLPKIGFEKIIDEFNYAASAVTLGWGLSDEELFMKWETVLDNEQQPFFSSALTITNHHPFEVPDEYKLQQGELVKDRFREAVHYTDAMLGKFLSRISKKLWFENTIIFITADTSSFQPAERDSKNFEEFVKLRTQVPLLILSGKSVSAGNSNSGYVTTQIASQVELAPTIMDLLTEKITVPWVGRSLLDPMDSSQHEMPIRAYTNRPGAYWAVIEGNTGYYQEDNKIDHFTGNLSEENSVRLKEDGTAWHKTIRWVLQENLLWPEK